MINEDISIKIFEQTFKKCNINYHSVEAVIEKLHCFLKIKPDIKEHPERLEFITYKFKGIQKNKKYILKFKSNSLVFSINNEILKIVDVFIDKNFQQKGIIKELLNYLKYFIQKEYPSIEFISLKSLPSGVIAWHKIGFEFFYKKHRLQVKTILTKILKKKIDLKTISKKEIEEINFYDILEKEIIGYIPMYLRIKQ